MVTKAITLSELRNMEIRIKSEINKEQTELRHEDRKKCSDCIWKVDEIDKKLAVNDNVLEHMTENFQEMKKSFDKLSEKIDGLDQRYSGKWTEKVLIVVGSAILLAIVGAFMTLILK